MSKATAVAKTAEWEHDEQLGGSDDLTTLLAWKTSFSFGRVSWWREGCVSLCRFDDVLTDVQYFL